MKLLIGWQMKQWIKWMQLMPYKNYEDKLKHNREYKKKLTIKRRMKFFGDDGCSICDSMKNLHAHHVDPNKKEHGDFWVCGEEIFKREIEKCVALCASCHIKVHANVLKTHVVGEDHSGSILKEHQVICIRDRVGNGEKQVGLAREFGVSSVTVHKVIRRKTWKHI